MAAISGMALGVLAGASAFSAYNEYEAGKANRRSAERAARKQTTIQANANALSQTRDNAGAEFVLGTDDPLATTSGTRRRTGSARINSPSVMGARSASAAGGL